jgi:hypothetical protein
LALALPGRGGEWELVSLKFDWEIQGGVPRKRKEMDAKKKVIESGKPVSQLMLRKMIATGKSIDSKVYEK